MLIFFVEILKQNIHIMLLLGSEFFGIIPICLRKIPSN